MGFRLRCIIFHCFDDIETYRVEAVKPGKITWQGDPRFQDSSSEEEDVTEETDDKKQSPEYVMCFCPDIFHNL